MTDSIIKKNWFIATLGILTVISTGYLIGTVIYYKRKGATVESPQNNSTAEEKIKRSEHNLLFLKESQDKIKKLEEDVKKEQGKKEYKKNELEILIAEKLANERIDKNEEVDYNNYSSLTEINIMLIDSYPIIASTALKLIHIKPEDKECDKLHKQLTIEFIRILPDTVLQTIHFLSYASNYVKSFYYYFCYFFIKWHDCTANKGNKQIEDVDAILNLLDTDEYGKFFKIYLLAEELMNTKRNGAHKGLLQIHEKIKPESQNAYFAKLLLNIVKKIAK